MGSDAEKKPAGCSLSVVLVSIALVVVVLSISPLRSCPHMIQRARSAKAMSEIKAAELALTKLAVDAGVRHMHDLFADPAAVSKSTVEETIEAQTAACYDLLRHGKSAEGALKPEVRSKLGSAYMDLRDDPWLHPYQFYFGPLSGSVNRYIFRSYRREDYVYDIAAYEEAVKTLPGAPRPDADMPPAKGFPCPGDLPVYIFSWGRNGHPDQLPWGGNGGDDINNWDSAVGWRTLY